MSKEIIIITGVLLILFVPWYIQQMGRFWCKGIIEYFEERFKKRLKKRRKNG